MADTQKFLDSAGVSVLWSNIKNKFVAKKDGYDLSKNDFTDALKAKLEGIEAGAQVNQNAFATISDGTNNIAASAASDSVKFVGTGAITVSADAATKQVTIDCEIPEVAEATQTQHGLMSAADKVKLDGVEAGAEVNQNAFAKVVAAGTTITAGSKSASFEVAAGTNVTVSGNASTGKITIAATDTTYNDATASVHGLMSAADKAKLDNIAAKAQVNVIETVKVNGTALAIDGKAVNVAVPTNNNQLTNGAGYQTAAQVDTAIKNALTTVYVFKGSVADATKLPTSDQKVGDVYNIIAASVYGAAGMNVVWTGSDWDALGSNITVNALTEAEVNALCV